jgi:protein-disulfide isomerase
MGGARGSRALLRSARGVLALVCALGSVACERPSQAAHPGEIDVTSPGGPRWSVIEPEAEADEPQLTDADVEKIAVKVPRERLPAVSARNPSKGPADAKVTLQVFSDFECPFCVRSAPTLADVEARYRGRVRMVWRNYPLPAHERARPAARAALEAFAQGGSEQFWKLHDFLFSPQANLSDAGLQQAAQKLGLDPSAIARAVQSTQHDAQINADMAAGDAAGIEGTPAVFINDYYLMGAFPESAYAVVIERALREASAK